MKNYNFIAVVFLLLAGAPAYADNQIEAVPTGWRLQNYVSNVVNIYFTGSACTSGALSLPANATSDDKNRLWSTILTAKATGRAVGIFYETVSGNCNITSFYAP
jgi:hypothetical protein